MQSYLWVKTFHLVFVMAWIAAAFYLPRILINLVEAGETADVRARLLLIPAGVMSRAATARFFDAAGVPLPDLHLAECLERGGEVDFWRLAAA